MILQLAFHSPTAHAYGGSHMHARTNHLTGTPRQSRYGWWHWHLLRSVIVAVALGLTLAPPYSVEAKTFYCRAGDVQCFIASITEANASAKQKNTINLEAGVYTLVDVNNTTDGPNGLPSITGSLAIRGVGNDLTRIERNINTPCFRILHVAATGVLTLDGLAVSQGANASERGAGLFNNGGAVTMTQTTFTGNRGDPFSCGFGSFPSGGGLYTTGGVE